MNPDTLAIHAGRSIDPVTGALVPAIELSTTFERDADGSYPRGYIYSRRGNPNRDALEQALAALEGGADAAAFSSGSAATMSVLQSLAPGDHVVLSDDVYHGTYHLLGSLFARWGLSSTAVDMTRLDEVGNAFRPETRLLWIESPSNPLLKITDIQAVTAVARNHGAISLCDSTFASPVVQRPLELGADLVLHATTKYLGGHGDLLGGIVVARSVEGVFTSIREIQGSGGAVPSPFDCWLLLRSLPTLPLRMRRHSESALLIARFLGEHPAVERVYYPGLEDHEGHAIAARQMSCFGGMLSFTVPGGAAEAMAVVGKARLFTRATSLGGVESLIEHRASIEGTSSRTPPNLVRLSVGLEHSDDLIEDLQRALG